MKITFTLILIFTFVKGLIGQKSKIDTIIHNNDYDYIDTVFNAGTIKIRTDYDYNWIKIDSNKYHRDNDSKYKAASGKMMSDGGSWHKFGLWKYWYDNGQLKEELIHLQKNDKRYLNQWTKAGEQILMEGNGKYFKDGYLDSVVYEVHDSLLHGLCSRWSKENKNDTFYLSEKSIFNKNFQEDFVTKYYRNGNIKLIYDRNDISLHRIWQEYHPNGKIAVFGYNGKYNKTGNWKFWNDREVLIKECNYIDGNLIGDFTQYNENGSLQVRGIYIHTTGKDTVMILDPNTGLLIEKVIDSNKIPAKHGLWYYYDDYGKLLRIDRYSEGKLD